jgi:tetratricopeptide (TPR) repeat protein
MQAESLLNEVTTHDPRNAFALVRLSELYLHNNELEKAAETLEQANNETSTRSKRGDTQFLAGRLFVNIACLRAVTYLRMDPTDPAVSLQLLHDVQVKVAPRSPSYLYLLLCLGEITGLSGDVVQALNLFNQASIMAPLHPLPYTNAARAYQQLQQGAAADRHLAHALQLDPTLAMTWVDMAQVSGGACIYRTWGRWYFVYVW